MNPEKPSPEAGDEEFFVQGLETFPRLEFTPIAGLKRWLVERRQRKEDIANGDQLRRELGAYAVMHPSYQPDSGADRFYGGPDILGVFTGVDFASAENFSRQLLPEQDLNVAEKDD